MTHGAALAGLRNATSPLTRKRESFRIRARRCGGVAAPGMAGKETLIHGLVIRHYPDPVLNPAPPVRFVNRAGLTLLA